MSNKGVYDIVFKKLTERDYQFDYKIDNSFFEALNDSEIEKGEVEVTTYITVQQDYFNLSIDVYGYVFTTCDRCLDDMKQEIDGECDFLLKFGEENENDDVIYIPEETGTVNIAWLIYETIALNIPMTHTHPEGECNEEMMNKLKAHLTYESSNDKQTNENNKQTDPRWDGLKNIITN